MEKSDEPKSLNDNPNHPQNKKVNTMTEHLPDSLRPTAADRANDAKLASKAGAILDQVRSESGLGVKWNTESYNSVTFGADGTPVARVRNGVPQQSSAEEAVARAQSAANSEIKRMEAERDQLTAMRDEISAYEPDGSPRYVRSESSRKNLSDQIRSLELGIVNQMRLNERRWRKEAAPHVERAEQAAELARKLEAAGKGRRTSGW